MSRAGVRQRSASVRAVTVVLREAGFQVQATHTAREALDRAPLRAPDAAILEILVPDSNGVKLCRQLRARSSAALIVLSAADDEDQKIRAYPTAPVLGAEARRPRTGSSAGR
jgi:DNA-binding response OmpR family regulator